MIEYEKKLFASPLFDRITPEEAEILLACLHVKTATYDKNECIFDAGQNIRSLGMVLSGCVHIIKEDYFGNQSILSEIRASEIFGETYACIEIGRAHV